MPMTRVYTMRRGATKHEKCDYEVGVCAGVAAKAATYMRAWRRGNNRVTPET